jgi:macrolide transport system ATP-binding/permease protein
VDTLWHDVRSGVRQLVKHPGFACIAVLTLALGIGANTAVFTMVDATLFKPINAVAPARLVWVTQREGRTRGFRSVSYPDYVAYRDRTRGVHGMMAYGNLSLALGGANAARVNGLLVSANYFEVLGLHPSAGRSFLPEEDRTPGTHPVAILSASLWRRRFGGDPDVIGRDVVINGHPFTVVGVGPAGFTGVGMGEPADLFVPLAMQAQAMPGIPRLLAEGNANWLRVIARLEDGVTLQRVNAEVARIGSTLHPERTDPADRSDAGVQAINGGLDPSNRSEALPVLSLLMVVPLLVLLVACANVANLLLARGMARRKELAVRRALGGARRRIVRQLLTESLLIAAVAGAFGALFAFWLIGVIVHLGSIPAEVSSALTPDLRVLAFTAMVAALTTVVFGLVPALSATSSELTPALKNENLTLSIGRSRHRLRDIFVIAQLSLSLLLLVTAGLFVRSLGKALRVDPGFDARNRAVLSFDLELQGYTPDARARFYHQLTERVTAMPGVESATITSALPVSGRSFGGEVQGEGASPDERGTETFLGLISPAYFTTMGIPVLHGRDFAANDAAGVPPVVIVNQTLAHQLWGDADPVGKRLRLTEKDEPLREVVGVVRDGKYASLTDGPRAFFYLPIPQSSAGGSEMTLVVHMRTLPTGAIQGFARVINQLDPNLPLSRALTLEESVRLAVDKQQAGAAVLGVFGALALLLAALGLYGVVAHGVALRTREIGIRVSLGAQRAQVMSLFVRDGARVSVIGIAIGSLMSLAVSKLLSGLLFGLTATDLPTFAGAAALLAACALVASYVPARRAAGVDPMFAMRAE